MTYRNLTASEIAALENQLCRCQDWQGVQVAEPFHADRIHGVRFSGTVRIGPQSGSAGFAGGLSPQLKRNDVLVADRLLDMSGDLIDVPAGLSTAAARP